MKRLVIAVITVLALAVPAQALATTTLTVVNNPAQTHISNAAVQRVEAAVQYQVNHTTALQWGKPLIRFGKGGWKVYITPDTWKPISQCGCGGYHDYKDPAPNGPGTGRYGCPTAPCAYVGTFLGQAASNGGPFWQEVFSHEVQEMVVDPHIQHFDTQYVPSLNETVNWLVEVADPVELDYAYTGLYGVTLEDHPLPSWYTSATGIGDQRGYVQNQRTGPSGVAYFVYQGQWYSYSSSPIGIKARALHARLSLGGDRGFLPGRMPLP